MDCTNCKAECCKHVAIEIDKPENISDFENIKWYVSHKNIKVWVNDEDEWHVEFMTPCEHLGEDYRCKIYDRRPEICKDYGMDDFCVNDDEDSEEKIIFNTIEDVENHIKNDF
ncbi:hypothetical protein C0585_06035 [Candidatus Woesearchaeota archaeon]|nr:MAG: hypothetical protein C0585_06035 [Candidatus Woesearchaeota archaeon]